MDLPAGKYHDTWQLVLPGWLSVWLLHYDHHLEHHIRPRLNWYELPALRAKLAREPELALHRVTLPQFFLRGLPRQELCLRDRRPRGASRSTPTGLNENTRQRADRYDSVTC